MKTYLIHNDDNVLDVSLFNVLNSMSIKFEVLTLPADHNEVTHLLKDFNGGIIFLPAIWKDLFCVKIIQQISLISTPFETVIVDAASEVSNLIVAFNEGLTAYLETPVTEEKLQQIISRTTARFENRISQLSAARRLSDLASQSTPFNKSHAMIARNQYLGKAFVDIVNKSGPLFDSSVEVLLVSSSSVQQKQLEVILKAMEISTSKTGNIKETIQIADKKEFTVVISDSILPDGDAIALADHLRKISKRMPHIIVWSSSPEKAAAMLEPENQIDEVILKPGPETGIESILPSIISSIYQI